MKFNYKKTAEVDAEIDLDVPYYYEDDSGAEYRMLGKLI